MHHVFCPDVLFYGSCMVKVTPVDHDGSGNEWAVYHHFRRFHRDGTYFDEAIMQCCRPLHQYKLNVNWNDCSFKPLLTMELKTSENSMSIVCRQKRKGNTQG
jgi:hypothetical protein